MDLLVFFVFLVEILVDVDVSVLVYQLDKKSFMRQSQEIVELEFERLGQVEVRINEVFDLIQVVNYILVEAQSQIALSQSK